MIYDEFLAVARELAQGATEGHWRSSVSRAYYAAYHRARALVEGTGGKIPTGERCHEQLAMQLQSTHDRGLRNLGTRLHTLRRDRNIADYDTSAYSRNQATRGLAKANTLLQLIESCERADPARLARAIQQSFS